jgi:hypothetical protein
VRAPGRGVEERRALVKRMAERAQESDEGAIEWTCWSLGQSAIISDDPLRWPPPQPKLHLFVRRRQKPEDGELARDSTGTWALARRRRGNPASDFARRDHAIRTTARFLKAIGYRMTRNAATRDKEGRRSAASIISQALAQLGIAMQERTIEDILWGRPKRPRR